MVELFRTLAPYLKRYRWKYIAGFVCLLIVDGAQILIPQIVRKAVDLISSGGFSLASIGRLSGLIVGVAVVLSSGRFLWRLFIHGSSRRIEAELRERLFSHLLRLSSSFFQNNKTGDLMARATNDLNAIRMAIGMGLVAFVDGSFMAIGILAVMFTQSPRAALYSILPLPIITLLILAFGKLVGSRFARVQEVFSSMSDVAQETMAGMRVVKSFVVGRWFLTRFADVNEDYKAANMALVRIFGFFFPLITFLSGVTTLVLLRVGGGMVVEGTMTAGELVSMFSYLQMLIWPMLGAGFTVNMLQRGAVSMTRVNEILNTEPAIASPPEGAYRPPEGRGGAIFIKDLSYSYGSSNVFCLEIDELSIPAGATIGITGKTGSGKTTLLRLLPRMLEPPIGTVLVDGVDVRLWELADLRSLFGVVPQDGYLFSESVKANIAYSDPSLPSERLEAVADLSTISRDFRDFKDGWNTVVGERGVSLSGGQKQRVSISRALAKSPRILLLDDALSAVDTETEDRILRPLLTERRGKTTLLVSHRVSTLRYADLILVLEGGRISERGSHEELLALGGSYAETARLQQLEQGREDR